MIFTNTGYKLSYILTHPHKIFMHWMRDIQCAWQRANKGYCFRDLWNVDLWFIEIMPKMIQELKERKIGYPAYLSEKEWDSILDEMIQCFKEANSETTSFINPYEEEYFEKVLPVFMYQFEDKKREISDDGYYTLKFIKDMDVSEEIKELDKKHYEKEKEKERFMEKNKKKGLELFVKYFDNLWD